MSDAGTGPINNATLNFSDAASGNLPVSGSLTAGIFKPTNYTDDSLGGDNFPSPAPAGPYASALSAFNGQNPNGPWSLYVFDDGPGDLGAIAAGWSLTITTSTSSLMAAFAPNPEPFIQVSSPAPNQVLLHVEGFPNKTYILQASDDLLNWHDLSVLNDPSGINVYSDVPVKARFYRAVQYQ
jgi:hypothetical protein